MPQAEHTSRRASAAAAAAASDMVPINSKKLGKRPVNPAAVSGDQRRVQPGWTAPRPKDGPAHHNPAAAKVAPSAHANGAGSSDEPGDLESQIESMEGKANKADKASKPPDKPPGALPRDSDGQLPLLQSRAGIDADESFGSQEYALSQYLKLHPVLSLESTSYQTLQLVADLVESTSIPTREVEVVSKPHDDQYLRCELPRLDPPRPGSSVPGGLGTSPEPFWDTPWSFGATHRAAR